MCYDMSYFSSIKLVSNFLNIPDPGLFDFTPTYHQVAQTFCGWPVALYDDGIKIRIFDWGLIADYMNTPEKIKRYRSSMANARSEKLLDDKRSVWHRLRQQRCLVFTTGFFEHRDIGAKKKLPYFISVPGQPVFCFAGLYNYSPLPDAETGEAKGTFAIMTRPANELMSKIHNSGENSQRMPVLLTKELALQWIQPTLTDEEIRGILSYEFPAGEMEVWPVDSIRRRKDDDAGVITVLDEEGIPAL